VPKIKERGGCRILAVKILDFKELKRLVQTYLYEDFNFAKIRELLNHPEIKQIDSRLKPVSSVRELLNLSNKEGYKLLDSLITLGSAETKEKIKPFLNQEERMLLEAIDRLRRKR